MIKYLTSYADTINDNDYYVCQCEGLQNIDLNCETKPNDYYELVPIGNN